MGGKQKRAAKMKRWTLAQSLLNQEDKEVQYRRTKANQNGTGDHSQERQPLTYEEKREILKRRQKKMKGDRQISWAGRRVSRAINCVDNWPSWPFTVCLIVFLYVLAFFVIRFLIQAFTTDKSEIDRSALFESLRQVVPKPLYKLCRLVDYLFCSRELSWQGVHGIMYPPDEYHRAEHPEYRFKANHGF